ncbi:fasciclin domain-containing protein [Parasphingorhabdus litoris]|uniref:Fasciclin domain-containing protein n=1 Tax=Parasphingorhabdus litoris TaxID=394733 RepID=A0ABN1AGP0_9SPHN|nr:fasciclin domain-containing protein [Parasphingorhabdus litoris]
MNTLSKLFLTTAALATISACSSEMSEEEQAIYDARQAEEAKPTNLTAIVQGNPDLSTASTMVAISGIAVELKDDGPFTVFVASNDAFNKMDQEELNGLMTAEDKSELASMARFGLVEGDLKTADIKKAIADGGGTASLTTLQGGDIKATLEGEKIVLEDGAGNKVNVLEADIESSNGTVHIIDTVLQPK